MRAQILQRFEDNVARVRNLVALYRASRAPGPGRRPVHSTDILRSAVVLLHASVEDVFRAVGLWRLPAQAENVLNEVPLIGLGENGRPEKFWLGKLAAHRTKTVQALIDESVGAHMKHFSVNSTTDIASFARRVGAEPEVLVAYFPDMNDMTTRRHHIVHQADRNDQPGVGQQRAMTISIERVERWISNADDCVRAFLEQVPDELL